MATYETILAMTSAFRRQGYEVFPGNEYYSGINLLRPITIQKKNGQYIDIVCSMHGENVIEISAQKGTSAFSKTYYPGISQLNLQKCADYIIQHVNSI
jgi:hypothetical protein